MLELWAEKDSFMKPASFTDMFVCRGKVSNAVLLIVFKGLPVNRLLQNEKLVREQFKSKQKQIKNTRASM